ncbi:MAG: hypothetical protein JW829_00295 [Pirellulales bacterium]|nr:hypothetical protein [Pirellulales bacterium]
MVHSVSEIELIKLAARLYYVDSLSQVEVARLLAVSQAKVSRLLQLAREKGVVQITVSEYEPRVPELEQRLADTYDLGHVAVIRDPHVRTTASIRSNVGYFGAPVVTRLLRAGQVIGLTGGRVLAELIRHVSASDHLGGLRVVQLMGSIGADVAEFDAVELSRRLANVLGGTLYTLNTPALVSSAASRNSFLKLEQVRAVWKLYNEMDVALVGIGSLSDSSFIERGTYRAEDLKRMHALGAVGEICGRFYDANGHECQSEFRDRIVSIQFNELRRIPLTVGVTAGSGRAEAIAPVLRVGLVKALIIDENGARAVLEIADKSNRKGKKKGAQVR